MVKHRNDEWARGEASTNTVEGFFSILKRGIIGVYHHVSQGISPATATSFLSAMRIAR